jgi:hypothetical protein
VDAVLDALGALDGVVLVDATNPLRWSDGHDTGIYSWDVLRRWWDGGLHGAMVIDPVPGPPAQDS